MFVLNEAFADKSVPRGERSIAVDAYSEDGAVVSVQASINTSDYFSANDQVAALFKKLRKMERGNAVVAQRQEQAEVELVTMQTFVDGFEALDPQDDAGAEALREAIEQCEGVDVDLDVTTRRQRRREKNQQRQSKQKKHFRKYKAPAEGVWVWAGRNRAENEELSSRVASPGDLWMHARHCPGSHVLIRPLGADKNISQETLQFGANIAAKLSKHYKEAKVDILVAEPKHLKKFPGATPGAFIVERELLNVVGFPARAPEAPLPSPVSAAVIEYNQ